MILVDSDVLIAHLRGLTEARTWLLCARAKAPLAVSVVSIAELTGGIRTAERREVWALLSIVRAETVTEVVARRAGEFMREFRRSHSAIGIADYLIAATAATQGARLATLNVRHGSAGTVHPAVVAAQWPVAVVPLLTYDVADFEMFKDLVDVQRP